MTDERLDWFPCNPAKLLGALAGMKAPEGYVYTIVLLRIYESGGACNDTLDALATRTRLNKRVVSDALDSLFRAGRLRRKADGIHNPKADDVISDSKALREKRKSAASDAANSRWEKTKQKQQTDDAPRNADAVRFDAQIQLQEQDSLFSNENRIPSAPEPDPPAKPKPKRDTGARLAPDWKPHADEIEYGEKLGLTREEVLAAGEEMRLWATANANRAQARKSNWTAAFQGWLRRGAPQIIRNRPRGPNNPNGGMNAQARNTGGGFSTIAARLRQEIANRETVDLRTTTGPESPHRH